MRSTDSLVKIGKWSDGEQIAQIWCQNEEGILSRQLSSLEVTARHAQVVRR